MENESGFRVTPGPIISNHPKGCHLTKKYRQNLRKAANHPVLSITCNETGPAYPALSLRFLVSRLLRFSSQRIQRTPPVSQILYIPELAPFSAPTRNSKNVIQENDDRNFFPDAVRPGEDVTGGFLTDQVTDAILVRSIGPVPTQTGRIGD